MRKPRREPARRLLDPARSRCPRGRRRPRLPPRRPRAHDFAFTDVRLELRADRTWVADVGCDVDALALGVSSSADSAALAAEIEALSPASRDELVTRLAALLKRRIRVRFDGAPAPFEVAPAASAGTRASSASPRARSASSPASRAASRRASREVTFFASPRVSPGAPGGRPPGRGRGPHGAGDARGREPAPRARGTSRAPGAGRDAAPIPRPGVDPHPPLRPRPRALRGRPRAAQPAPRPAAGPGDRLHARPHPDAGALELRGREPSRRASSSR